MTKEELKSKLGEDLLVIIENIYKNANGNYEKFTSDLINFEFLLERESSNIKEVCEVFVPFVTDIEPELELDEEGNPLDDFLIDYSEISDSLISQFNGKSKGWITKKKEKDLLGSHLFNNVLRKNMNLNPSVMFDVVQNALHILGRSNNPKHWGKNKQGLVMGMVQSGKTMSMLTLMGMGIEAGYDLIILLAGTKEDLRRQSQNRINDAFKLHEGGFSVTMPGGLRLYSPTFETKYTRLEYRANLYKPLERHKIIITVLKENANLKRLINDINNLKKFCKDEHIDFGNRYRTMILDDESDNASLEIDARKQRGINKQLTELRKIIPFNCYIGYTATPQGCLAAKMESTVGYPKDFLWLLEPVKLPGNPNSTLSYLGLHEFFIQYKDFLLKSISPNSWPHHVKNDKGKSTGILNPLTGKVIKANLNELENQVANYYNENISKVPQEYFDAIIDYLIGCGLRWYRYYKQKTPGLKIPDSTVVKREYPYHAMMFNLSLTKNIHQMKLQLVEKCFKKVVLEYEKWLKDDSLRFETKWIEQINKTHALKIDEVIRQDEKGTIKKFIKLAIDVSREPIEGGQNFVYMLNSLDEGDELDYTKMEGEKGYIKKAAIFVGGNILSRGLTIENLSVSFFVRTQSITLGDTTLQMCRWFGHKKADIDIISLYLMDKVRRLFNDLTRCDNALRRSIKHSIAEGKSPEKVLIELWSSNLFNVTSSLKAKELKAQAYSAVSYTGVSRDLREPFCGNDVKILKETADLFDEYINNIRCFKKSVNWLKRGDLFEDVDLDQLKDFLELIKIPKEALYVSPASYLEYLSEWTKGIEEKRIDKKIPKINIGVLRTDTRDIGERKREYDIEPTSKEEAKRNFNLRISALSGGSSGNNYMGDKFFEMNQKWHVDNFRKKFDKKEMYSDSILILFYKLNPNYLGNWKFKGSHRKEKVYLTKSEGINLDWILTMGVHTPNGGPMFKIHTRKMIMP